MRLGKKTNIAETKKTRSCVVRLEKVSQALPPRPATTGRTPPTTTAGARNRNNSVASGSLAMGATPKQPTTASHSREEKSIRGAIKKRAVGSTGSKPQTPQQKQPTTTSNMSALRSSQKIKAIPRANRMAATISTPQVSTTPVRDDTPTPTIAAGRSRRAIKPNPKYASEDMVTPKMMRNVGVTKAAAVNETKQRKVSSSSDDFYNNNSDDDYEEPSKKMSSKFDDMERDKAYKVDEKEAAAALDSDMSDIEEELTSRAIRLRGRPRKIEPTPTPQIAPKATTQTTNSNLRRVSNTTVLPVRTAPTQLQQLRRSLASANAQRNQSLLAGSSSSIAQKRKLDESLDSDDSETSYTVARKQMLVSNTAGVKVRVPVKQNSIITSTTPLNRNRVLGVQKVGSSATSSHSLNGRPISSQIMERRKIIESTKTSVDLPPKMGLKSNLLANKLNQIMSGRNNRIQTPITKTVTTVQPPSAANKTIAANSDVNKNRVRTSSPRPSFNRESLSNTPKAATPSSSSTAFTPQQQKKLPTLTSKTLDKSKTAPTSNTSNMAASKLTVSKPLTSRTKPLPPQQNTNKTSATPAVNATPTVVINDESPNSTMDDFETMPTFTIVNVNDIINKKGDVLITKSKTSPNSGPKTTVIEFSESISLDEEEDDDDELGDNIEQHKSNTPNVVSPAISNKLSPSNSSRMEINKNKSPGSRNKNETLKKPISTDNSSKPAPVIKPQILNHKLGLRNNQRVTPKTTASLPPPAPEKPAPRILNSVVAKRTEPVKPMIANLDDSAEESFPLSLDEEETDDEGESKSFGTTEKKTQEYSMDLDTDDTESQNTEPDEPTAPPKALTPKNNSTTPPSPQSVQRRRRPASSISTPIVVSNKKRLLTPAAAKENSLAATNQQVNDTKAQSLMPQTRKAPAEKVVISKQGDKIIKKITCFETWYVINLPLEPKRQSIIRNQLDIPLIKLANNAKAINLPSDLWSCKVTLYELSAMTLAKSTLATYTGDLTEYNIHEEDRAKYQPSCVMFRRSIENRQLSRMPYDRAVIFKNKTFSTNIEGKNIRLLGAPSVINSEREIEILLEVVDALTLQSDFVENASALQ